MLLAAAVLVLAARRPKSETFENAKDDEGYFLVANGVKYLDMVKDLAESIRIAGDRRPIAVLTTEADAARA